MPWNLFKPSSKIFYWLFQGGTSFVDLLCFFLSCVCYAFVCVCLYVPCGHLLGKGWPLGTRLSRWPITLLLTFCLLLLLLWESVIVLYFVVCYFMSVLVLVLQSSWWGRESWLLCLICLPCVSWWLSGSSSRCHGVVCGLWLWYFLIILTYYFWVHGLNEPVIRHHR